MASPVRRAAVAALLLSTAACASTTPVVVPPRESPAVASPLDPARTTGAPAPAEPKEPDEPVSARQAAEPRPGASRPVAWVGDRPITESDLLATLLFFYRREYHDALSQAVNDVVVEEETKRLGVTVDAREVARRAEDEIGRLEGEVLVQFGGEVTLEAFVRDNFRLSLEEYRANLHRVVRSRLALGRLVRFEELRQERLDLRKIVVGEKTTADAVVASLRDGADFAILAEKHSIAPSAKVGGRLPPVPRGALHPDLEAAALALEPGGVSDAIEIREGPTRRYHIVKLVRRIPARDEKYAAVREEIEKGLEAEGVSDAEVAYWNESMTRRYGIRFDE